MTDVNNPSTPPVPPPGKLLLNRDDLRGLGINYSNTHLNRLIRDGRFPRPLSMGPGMYARKAWRRTDIEGYLASLVPYEKKSA